MVRVALLDDYQGVAMSMADWSRLPAGSEVQAFPDHLFDEDALIDRLKDFDAIIAMRERTPFPRSLLGRLPKLRLLVTTGARNASFDMPATKDLGITVCGTRGLRFSTAQLTWGLILSLTRGIHTEHEAVHAGRWQVGIGPDLQGKKLGVVGLGNLGSAVAAVGKAFEMEVLAWSQNLTAERAAAQGVRFVSKEELFSTADVISIHLILSDRSRGLIGAADLALMKPDAYFVNTSRGPLVDEAALVAALRGQKIAGAALDVFDREPLAADHPFLHLDNVLITPHIGYVTTDGYRLYYGDALEDVLTFLDGNPLRKIES